MKFFTQSPHLHLPPITPAKTHELRRKTQTRWSRLSSPSEQTHMHTSTRRRLTQQSDRKRPGSRCAHCLPPGSALRSDAFLTFVLHIPLPGPRSLTGYLGSRLRVKMRHCPPNCFRSILPIYKDGSGNHLVFLCPSAQFQSEFTLMCGLHLI